MKAFPHHYFRLRRRVKITVEPSISKEPSIHNEKRRPKLKKTVLGLLSIAIIFAAFFVLYENPNILNLQNLLPKTSTPTPTPTPSPTSTPTPAPTPTNDELVDYALSLINSDRQQNGLQNVTLSSIDSGQLHAEDMLKNGYYSHWDMNGYKPYMRYTLAGGQGAVAENIDWQPDYPYFGLEQAIKNMEYVMMYNDSASNWGHKDNILNPFHNKVSIGIAYDKYNVYFVEDFEDDYVEWSTLSSSGSQVEMSGTITQPNLTISQVAIYYDNVGNLTVQQLSNSLYQGGYDSGTYVGQILPPLPAGGSYSQPESGIIIIATAWSQTGQNFDITFDLSPAFAQSGVGVYTLCLWTDSNTYLTTYSIWNSG